MKIFGEDVEVIKNQLLAVIFNISSWILTTFFFKKPSSLQQDSNVPSCISISGPGGLDRLELKTLGDRQCTGGYNLGKWGHSQPFVDIDPGQPFQEQFHPEMVLVDINYFSVNYADVCIRWGLYESALRYVGWPIVPGFDFSGTVKWAGEKAGDLKPGDQVFGVTMFGAYSKRCLVPGHQCRKVPSFKEKQIPLEKIAGITAVATTALHAVACAKAWPNKLQTNNKGCLIHSAAGGVGSQLVRICKIQGYNPVVAVVGSSHKVDYCKQLGAHHVIDKSKQDLWKEAERISEKGYNSIFDANGVETIQQSYDHLDRCGSLIVYGFHSNLPKAATMLSPWNWVKVVARMIKMPKFDPMDLTLNSKCVAGFNLSFFESERALIDSYFEQLVEWLQEGLINVTEVTVYDVEKIREAHEFIQSGQSRGKIVLKF